MLATDNRQCGASAKLTPCVKARRVQFDCGPEGRFTVTTIYFHTGHVRDRARWLCAASLHERVDAQGRTYSLYVEPSPRPHLDEDGTGMLMPWLDEVVSLSIDGEVVRDYMRIPTL